MARADGRNLVMSWTAGLFCVAIVAALIWFAVPMAPVLVDFVGDTLRTIAPGTAEIP